VREELKDGENFLFFSDAKPESLLALKKQVSFDLDGVNEPKLT